MKRSVQGRGDLLDLRRAGPAPRPGGRDGDREGQAPRRARQGRGDPARLHHPPRPRLQHRGARTRARSSRAAWTPTPCTRPSASSARPATSRRAARSPSSPPRSSTPAPHGRGDLRGVQGHRQHGAPPRPAPGRRRIFPAMDIQRSAPGRRSSCCPQELNRVWVLRKVLSAAEPGRRHGVPARQDAKTKSNAEFLMTLSPAARLRRRRCPAAPGAGGSREWPAAWPAFAVPVALLTAPRATGSRAVLARVPMDSGPAADYTLRSAGPGGGGGEVDHDRSGHGEGAIAEAVAPALRERGEPRQAAGADRQRGRGDLPVLRDQPLFGRPPLVDGGAADRRADPIRALVADLLLRLSVLPAHPRGADPGPGVVAPRGSGVRLRAAGGVRGVPAHARCAWNVRTTFRSMASGRGGWRSPTPWTRPTTPSPPSIWAMPC
ncbi:MAG: hypothetical protein KatS3mg102_0622 [Planctomycetota bacterium]|nr:MAG: hypothetical protein KatS3mg102_0622 [Planctomycetota bacterium]